MKSFLARGIVFRLNAIILSLISVGLLAFAVIVGVNNYQQVTEDLTNKSNNTLKLASIALRDSIWNMNDEGLKAIVEAIMSDTDVAGVKILEADGETDLLFQMDDSYEGQEFSALKVNKEFLYDKASVLNEGDEIGYVEMVISTERANSVIRSTAMLIVFFTVLLIVVIGTSVSITANRIIKIPIDILKDEANHLAQGNLDQEINTGRADELGSLARSFVAMRDAIREKIQLIEEYNRNLEHKVEERTAALRQKTNDIQAMMQNIHQGVFTLLQGNVIHHEYSTFLEHIIQGQDIAGAKVMEALFSTTNLGPDTLDQMEVGLSAIVGEDAMMYDFNKHVLVKECEKQMPDGTTLVLEFDWIPILDKDDCVEKVMVTVRDVTEVRKLLSEAKDQRVELEIIGEILATSQEKFNSFVQSSVKFIEDNSKLIDANPEKETEVIEELFRNMHTIKGNARTLGFLHLTQNVHETEQDYTAMRKDGEAGWNREQLLDQLNSSKELLEDYIRINTKKLGRKGPGRRGEVAKYLMVPKDQIEFHLKRMENLDDGTESSMRYTLKGIRNTLLLLGTASVEEVLSGILESLPSLAEELDKEVPEVTVNSNQIFCKTQTEGVFRNTFMHLFRNSLDHGIESPSERQSVGKGASGHIQLDLSRVNERICMIFKDDGGGLDLNRIKNKALEQGVITEGDKISPKDAANLIFSSGLSTADKVTEVSGRGVGMDAVKKFIEREKGTIEIQLVEDGVVKEGRTPFEIMITLPDKNFVCLDN